jgi:hypothetical protein
VKHFKIFIVDDPHQEKKGGLDMMYQCSMALGVFYHPLLFYKTILVMKGE